MSVGVHIKLVRTVRSGRVGGKGPGMGAADFSLNGPGSGFFQERVCVLLVLLKWKNSKKKSPTRRFPFRNLHRPSRGHPK